MPTELFSASARTAMIAKLKARNYSSDDLMPLSSERLAELMVHHRLPFCFSVSNPHAALHPSHKDALNRLAAAAEKAHSKDVMYDPFNGTINRIQTSSDSRAPRPKFCMHRPDLQRVIELKYAAAAPICILENTVSARPRTDQLVILQVLRHYRTDNGQFLLFMATPSLLHVSPELRSAVRKLDVSPWKGMVFVEGVQEPLADDGMPVLGGYVLARAAYDNDHGCLALWLLSLCAAKHGRELRRTDPVKGFVDVQ